MAVVEDELSLVFSALADPTRRAILERLAVTGVGPPLAGRLARGGDHRLEQHQQVDGALRGSVGGGLETIVACFHDRHLLNRVAVSTAISYAALGRMELQLFAWLGLTAHKLHLERISYLSLSAVWNILYWTGVRDGLRGNEPFRRMLRRTRHHRQRPYRRVSVTSPH